MRRGDTDEEERICFRESAYSLQVRFKYAMFVYDFEILLLFEEFVTS